MQKCPILVRNEILKTGTSIEKVPAISIVPMKL